MTTITLPTYICKLPSTGKNINFRPFTVKEEKNLLLALEENDINVVAEALKTIITNCTSSKVDVDTIPYYDMEFLFLQIRSKSVGELIDLIGSCDCSETAKTEFTVDIGTAVVNPKPSGTLKMKVPDTNYNMELRHPSLSDFILAFSNKAESGTNTVARCIKTVYTDDEVFDWDFDKKVEFLDSMSPKQQKDIEKFLKDMPAVSIDSSYKCCKCGKEHKQALSGFENFFV